MKDSVVWTMERSVKPQKYPFIMGIFAQRALLAQMGSVMGSTSVSRSLWRGRQPGTIFASSLADRASLGRGIVVQRRRGVDER